MNQRKQNCIRILVLILLFVVSGCEDTDYAPGFSADKLATVREGEKVDDVLAKLGLPLRALLYSKDYRNHPLPSGGEYELIPLPQISERSREQFRVMVLQYSIQGSPESDYWRNNVLIEDGKVE